MEDVEGKDHSCLRADGSAIDDMGFGTLSNPPEVGEVRMRWHGWMEAVCAAALALTPMIAKAAGPDVLGSWVIHADWGDASIGASVEFKSVGGVIEGVSGPLDIPGFFPLRLRGAPSQTGVHLVVTSGEKAVGVLDIGTTSKGVFKGSGRLFGSPVSISAVRATGPDRSPSTFDFQPEQFHVLTSNAPAPVLRLVSGDTVRTRTVDAAGADEKGQQAAMAGNAATGPFYVEGAMPGDTLAVRIVKLTPNRGTAFMARRLAPTAVAPGYASAPTPDRTDIWRLDPVGQVASIASLSDRLKDFKVPLRPMLGVVAVAPPAGLSEPNGDLGEWGGNLDFPEITEGATLYLPVYQPGALLFLGDAHARQSDGEVTGQGLETSMAVEFQVYVIKSEGLGRQLWSENSEYIMVSGIGGSLNEALGQATSGLARWLKLHKQLDDNDVAEVLGSSIEYQIAEVVDGKFHVAAKLKKSLLAQISPPTPAPAAP